MLRAFRKVEGTQVQRGELIRDFRGDSFIFHAATRAADGHRAGKIQVGSDFGPEYYEHVFPDLIVRDVPDDTEVLLRFPGFPAVAGTGPVITAQEG